MDEYIYLLYHEDYDEPVGDPLTIIGVYTKLSNAIFQLIIDTKSFFDGYLNISRMIVDQKNTCVNINLTSKKIKENLDENQLKNNVIKDYIFNLEKKEQEMKNRQEDKEKETNNRKKLEFIAKNNRKELELLFENLNVRSEYIDKLENIKSILFDLNIPVDKSREILKEVLKSELTNI